MISLLSLAAIKRIDVFSHWVGFANPPSHSAKLTITNVGERFIRQREPEKTTDELSDKVVLRVLKTLTFPTIPQLDPSIFDMPAVIERHYSSCWTDDHPSHLIRFHFHDGRQITIQTNAQYAFMLPLRITDSATNAPYDTFDPELSRALSELMPEGFLHRERLAGHSGMLELDLREAEQQDAHLAAEPAPILVAPESTCQAVAAEKPIEHAADASDARTEATASLDELASKIHEILFGEETAQRAAEYEQSGRLSERLLQRNSLETARELLARGADPSIADDVGQTALMHAAFPPFDRERFRLLVDAGANIEARRDGLTGLHLACAGGEAEAVVEWVRAGADITARTPEGSTPLMLGATWPRIVRTLLDELVEVNATDDDGHSALVYAILNQCSVSASGHLSAMQAMIDAGADVNLKDRNGVSPLGHAKKALAEALLEEEVILAFNPAADLLMGMDWNDRKLAEHVVALLLASGAVS